MDGGNNTVGVGHKAIECYNTVRTPTLLVFKGPVQSGFLPKFGRTGTVTGH